MSGGAFDYFYRRLEEMAYLIYQEYSKEEKILSQLLKDLAEVLHDLEWWKSDDISFEKFQQTFEKFANKWLKDEVKEKE